MFEITEKEEAYCSLIDQFLVVLKKELQHACSKWEYFPLNWTLSFVTLHTFLMLKEQHHTLNKVEIVKKHNRTL